MTKKEEKEVREGVQNAATPSKTLPLCDVCNDIEKYPACPECCEHEFDWDEGYTCLNCGAQGDVGRLIDSWEYTTDPER